MSTSVDFGGQPEAATLHESAISILLSIHNQADEEASTTTIRDATGLSAANISGHHARTLMDRGYIEKVGTESGDAPRDANVYGLTHRGRKEANNLLKERQAPMSEVDKIKLLNHLQDRVDELEQMLEESRAESGRDSGLREQVEKNTEYIKNHTARLKDHEDGFERIESTLKKIMNRL